MGERCSACMEAWSTCFGVAPADQNIALPWPNTSAPFSPTARLEKTAASDTAPPLRIWLFQGVHGLGEAWAGCTSSLTQLVCTPATPLIG
jgi:hypothetical protein